MLAGFPNLTFTRQPSLVDVGMGVESLTGNTICLSLVQATKQHLDFFSFVHAISPNTLFP
jgi:hypothetical protein